MVSLGSSYLKKKLGWQFRSSFVVAMGWKSHKRAAENCVRVISHSVQKYANKNAIKQWKHIFIIYMGLAASFLTFVTV